MSADLWLVLDGYGGERPVAVRPSLVRILRGNASAAILLAQFLYWTRIDNGANDGWFYNSGEKLEQQTGLSDDAQRSARRALRNAGVLQEDLKGLPARLHYRVDLERVMALITGAAILENKRDANLKRAESNPELAAGASAEQVPGTSGNLRPEVTRNKFPEVPGTPIKGTETKKEIKEEIPNTGISEFENFPEVLPSFDSGNAAAPSGAVTEPSEATLANVKNPDRAPDASTDSAARSKGSGRRAPLVLPELPVELASIPGFLEAWEKWQQFRRQIRKALVPSTVEEQFEFLLKQPDPVAVIKKSIGQQWTGLFALDAPREDRAKRNSRIINANARPRSTDEANAALQARFKRLMVGAEVPSD